MFDVTSVYFMCCSGNGSICLMCCMFERVSELFGDTHVGSQVFALLWLFLCVILHTMWSGKNMLVDIHLARWYVVIVCHQYDVCKHYVGSVYVGGYDCQNESGLCLIVQFVRH